MTGLRVRRRLPRLLSSLVDPLRRRAVPVVVQMAVADCGAACLAMVLRYHGRHVPFEEVRSAAGVTRDGVDALSLLRTARLYGLQGRGLRVRSLEELEFVEPGSILHWEFNHFVVLERRRPGGAEIVDPSHGRRFVPDDELRRAFTGIALTFHPDQSFTPRGGGPSRVGVYVRRVLTHSREFYRLFAASLIIQVIALAIPVATGLIVDRVIPGRDWGLATLLAVGTGILVLFQYLASLVRAHLLVYLRTRLDSELTRGFVSHLLALPYPFFAERSAGDLLTRTASNATIREMLTAGALSALLDGSLVGIYLLLLLIADPRMGLLVLGLAALRIAVFLATRRRRADLMAQALAAEGRSRGYQVEMLAAVGTLKASGTEHRAVERWENLFVDVLNVNLRRGRLDAHVNSLLETLSVASPLAVLLFGTHQVLTGALSLGTMLALYALAAGFLVPLTAVITTAFQLQLLGAYLDRLNDVLETPREEDGKESRRVVRLGGQVALEGVTFRFGPLAPPVVSDVSFEVNPGEFVAIVGASGAGKSTMVGLLLGLYAPSAGRVLYDGADLASLDLHAVRSQVGVVLQDPFIFGTTIRENIALADPGADLDAVVAAARAAHVHEVIMRMPMGYDTPVADRGASLSGGTRQRLAIARALLTRPKVLALDEATSALDSVTERKVQRALASLRCSRIVVAHRLSTIREADRILVMEAGRIVEEGDHLSLTAAGGRYAELLESQARVAGASA
ncbi:MAG TPA: peptidase domain-containing ABC transporter [Longimicrobiaceae bacterium]|nr:peptidase domain-containing ABC transporter [Longimicrobiaceae bacterium]